MEFVHLSAGGKDLLAEMIADLARFQAVMNKLKSARREMDEESFRKELEEGKLQAAMLSQRFPFLRTILTAERSGEGSAESSGERSGKSSERNQPASAGQNRIVESQPFVIAVDLFG
jgi:hypothetical protein